MMAKIRKGKSTASIEIANKIYNDKEFQKTINSLRGIERWGSKKMVEASFQGFQALPYYENGAITKSYFDGCNTQEGIKNRFRELAKKLHPDVNDGKADDFIELNKQYEKLNNPSKN